MTNQQEFINTSEMANWPGTPGPDRLKHAVNVLENRARLGYIPEPIKADAKKLAGKREIEDFEYWARREMTKRDQGKPITLDTLLEITAKGSNQDYIGVLVTSEGPQETVELNISQLFRHPEWVGLHPILPSCQGKQALIVGNPEQGERTCVVLISPQPLDRSAATEERQYEGPVGEALTKTLRWHGTTKIEWFVEPSRDTGPEASTS